MALGSGFQGKMDALDLIISVLKDHERKLDEISRRLEDAVGELEANEEKR